MGDVLREAYEAIGRAIERFGEFIQHFDPTSWIAWLQVVSLSLAISWTLYQFTRARRLNETEVEDWIEQHLDDKPRNLMKERGEYLERLNSAAKASYVARGLRAIRARAKMVVLFLVRIILVRKREPSASHAMLLFDAGNDAKGGAEFRTIAADFEKTALIYEKQVRAKRLEACNAYLYAGRIAAELGDSEATKHAYENVLRLNKGDADAYKLIGRQYLDVGNIKGALSEYAAIANHAVSVGDKTMEAEAYRLQAKAHSEDNRLGRARRMLSRSEQTEPSGNYRGIAETQKMLGDLFARQGSTAAATTAYTNSIANYGHAGDAAAVADLQEVLDRMGRQDPWLTTFVEKLGKLMLQLAMQLRNRARRP